MRWLLVIVLLLALLAPIGCWAQEFQFRQEFDTIPVEINGWRPWSPFSGGVNESYPEFCDIDGDGDLDMFIGNLRGFITYYQNEGVATSPQYVEITPQFAEVSLPTPGTPYHGRTSPAFCDIDTDGDYDLFSGDGEGLVHFWRNTGNAQNPVFQWATDSLAGIDLAGHSRLAFWDIDHDGDYDLFIGDYYGRIAFYRNTGTPQQYNFSLVTNNWLNIDVGYHSSPCFVDIDHDGDQDLFIGNREGKIWFYRNDGDSLNYNFTYVTNYYDTIDVDGYATPKFSDVDGDGDYDLFVGRDQQTGYTTNPGDVFYYRNNGTPANPQWQFITPNYLSIDEGFLTGISSTDIDGDGDVDLFLEDFGNYLTLFQNIGTETSPAFRWMTDSYQNLNLAGGDPDFSDIDSDQDPDLLIGEVQIPCPPYPNLYLYTNTGTPQQAQFPSATTIVPQNYWVSIHPEMADIDADGTPDLFICDGQGVFYYFHNIGSPTAPAFASPIVNWQGLNHTMPVHFKFYDLDGDQDLDLFMTVADTGNQIWFYRNNGTPQNPQFALQTQTFLGTAGEINASDLDIVDIDHDGDGDFILANAWGGGLYFFRNITGESGVNPKRPEGPPERMITVLPNPGNSGTTISYVLDHPQKISLDVFNLLGAKVASLVFGLQLPGNYSYTWDASAKASGIYFLRFTTPDQSLSRKITILK